MMNKPIIILRHSPQIAGIGVIGDILVKLEMPYKCIYTVEEDISLEKHKDYQGVIVLGSPVGIYEAPNLPWLQNEIEWVRQAAVQNMKIFGICFGCQMLAHIFGGNIFKGNHGMSVAFRDVNIVHPDPIFGDELQGLKSFSWHQDTYTLKNDAQRLAIGDIYIEQAAKFADNIYGVQFHPEIRGDYIRHLHSICGETINSQPHAMDLENILLDAKKYLSVNHNWLELFIRRFFL